MQNKFSKIAASALSVWLLAVSFLPMGGQVALAAGNKALRAAQVALCQNSTSTFLTATTPTGPYKLQTNRWNTTNVTPSASYNLCITYDNASATDDFELTTQEGTAPTNAGPTSYPSIIAGCHWVGVCSPNLSGMPILYSDIASIPSSWSITTTPGGTFDASYDIWFNKTAVVSNPDPTNGQNNGAEVMVWLDSRGYSNQQNNPAGTIRPTGTIQSTPFTAAGFTFDVWIGQLTGPAPDSVSWNVISFVRRNAPGNLSSTTADSSMIGFDAKTFSDYASTLNCPNGAKCILPTWYLLSVQAGFEPWTGGGASGANHGLTSKGFKVMANKKTGGPQVVPSDRTTDDGRPIDFWGSPFTVQGTSCPNTHPTLTVSELGNATNPVPGDPPVTVSGASVVETPAGSGTYVFNVPALAPMHGDVLYTITSGAGCSLAPTTSGGYIDPSGKVRTPAGDAVAGATVTLSQLNGSGTFVVVPSGSSIMSAANQTNPDTTGKDGSFGWDVLPGTYKVRAEKVGCVSPSNPAQAFVETGNLVVTAGHPVTDIDLRLNCPGGGTGLPVVLTKTTDFVSGYCATVTVTNNTAASVDWNVNFSIAQFGGGTIYTFWNAVYTANGSQITNVHADPANPWNKTLQPGESTHDIGFCANR